MCNSNKKRSYAPKKVLHDDFINLGFTGSLNYIDAKGGIVRVKLVDKDDNVIYGYSICDENDEFVSNIGNQLALDNCFANSDKKEDLYRKAKSKIYKEFHYLLKMKNI